MKFIMSFILLMVFVGSSQSQEVISTAGEVFETTNGSISWTIGEPVIATLVGTDNSLTQGFHQPVEIPTIGQWGLIICGLCFVTIGTVGIENAKDKYLYI